MLELAQRLMPGLMAATYQRTGFGRPGQPPIKGVHGMFSTAARHSSIPPQTGTQAPPVGPVKQASPEKMWAWLHCSPATSSNVKVWGTRPLATLRLWGPDCAKHAWAPVHSADQALGRHSGTPPAAASLAEGWKTWPHAISSSAGRLMLSWSVWACSLWQVRGTWKPLQAAEALADAARADECPILCLHGQCMQMAPEMAAELATRTW